MQNDLEAYLSALEAQLTEMPAARRAEFLDEARAHLHAMFEARRADGADAATAWLQVAAEFGEPAQVGRELREQWASSGQLETEGAPLTKWEWVRNFGIIFVAIAALEVFIVSLPKSAWEQMRNYSAYGMVVLAMIAFWSLQLRRAGRRWTFASVLAHGLAFLLLMQPVARVQWPQIETSGFEQPMSVGFCLLMAWVLKREIGNRPWQWSARFKSSPVAAEQEFRFTRLFAIAAMTTTGCANIIWMGTQFFALPIAPLLLACAGFSGVNLIVWRWLVK